MSFLFEQPTSEIQRLGSALKVPQDIRAPFDFGLNIGGNRAVGFNQTGPTSGEVDVRGAPGFQNSLSNVQTANTAANNRFGSLIGGLQSNDNPFIKARVRPFEEAARQNTAAVQRDVGRRNIQGSLGQNQISNARFEGARGVSDQGALATQETLSAQLAAEAGRLGVGGEQLDIADTQLQGELQSISSGMAALNQALSNQKQTSNQLTGSQANSGGDNIAGLLEILGQIFP